MEIWSSWPSSARSSLSPADMPAPSGSTSWAGGARRASSQAATADSPPAAGCRGSISRRRRPYTTGQVPLGWCGEVGGPFRPICYCAIGDLAWSFRAVFGAHDAAAASDRPRRGWQLPHARNAVAPWGARPGWCCSIGQVAQYRCILERPRGHHAVLYSCARSALRCATATSKPQPAATLVPMREILSVVEVAL
eukprot:COSAG04_NODE_2996_length_3295_cov_4.057259_5_plen_194_part_00